MTTRLVGYQPQYFPRLHYFARILNADIFKISDNLQYVRRHAYPAENGTSVNGPSFQAHAPIKTSQGSYLLDLPVKHVGKQRDRTMHTVGLDYDSKWQHKHLATIEISYAKAPNFKKLFPQITALLETQYPNLAACTIATTLWGISALFEIPLATMELASVSTFSSLLPLGPFRLNRIVRMSEEGLQPADKRAGQEVSEWIAKQCKALGADEYYYGGTAAATYIDQERLQESGIKLVQQDWKGEEYPQQFPKVGFLPNLSIIDLLMNTSLEDARRILATPNQ